MAKYIFIGLGGFIGSVFRYLLSLAPISVNFPVMTLVTNLVGAFFIGAITEIATKAFPSPNLTLFLTVGLCGGFTTFSTFSLETVGLLEKGKILLGLGYALFSVAFCLLGVIFGRLAGRAVVC